MAATSRCGPLVAAVRAAGRSQTLVTVQHWAGPAEGLVPSLLFS